MYENQGSHINHQRKGRKRRIRRIPRKQRMILHLTGIFAGIVLLVLAGGSLWRYLHQDAEIAQQEDIIYDTELPEPVEVAYLEETAEEDGQHVFTVCVDAGHGGKDIGANKGQRLEKDDALRMAKALQEYLEENDVRVVMTRDTDDFLKLSARCDIANEARADYLVSLHRNTGEGYGVEAWILSTADEETEAYANAIMGKLEEAGISRNRGVKKGTQASSKSNYAINVKSYMPSCIVELGFMSSFEDNELMDTKVKEYAAGIGDAIIETYQTYQEKKAEQMAANAGGDGAAVSGDGLAVSGQGAMTDAGSTDPDGNVTSIKLVNDPIDEQSADTALIEWGQGRNYDDLNRPGGCLMYQQKYGDMSAYFLGPWQEGDPKVIYLTFDIGYTNESTVSILNTLKEKGVKAVFFATLPVVNNEPDIVNRIINEGHELANHSVTHPSAGLPSETVEEQRAEIMDVHNACLEKYGYEMHLFRFPAGKFSAQSLAIANNCNYRSVFWSWAHADWNPERQPDVASSLQEAVARLHPGAIYLLHGISSTNASMLGDLIDQAQDMGYVFELLQ